MSVPNKIWPYIQKIWKFSFNISKLYIKHTIFNNSIPTLKETQFITNRNGKSPGRLRYIIAHYFRIVLKLELQRDKVQEFKCYN